MGAPALALTRMAEENGVVFKLGAKVTGFEYETADTAVSKVCIGGRKHTTGEEGGNDEKGLCEAVSGVVASADYHHVEQNLLDARFRRYYNRCTPSFREARTSRSC
jgi:phytoene dehydrogenase-like protein